MISGGEYKAAVGHRKSAQKKRGTEGGLACAKELRRRAEQK